MSVEIRGTGGAAAVEFLKERFGIEWGDDIYGIPEDGVQFDFTPDTLGNVTITLFGRCTQDDANKFIRKHWGQHGDS